MVPAHLGSPGQRAIKWMCVCVCVCVCARAVVLCMLSSGTWQLTVSCVMACPVERTAGTMMQRMSDMLTRWLEGAVQRAENEAESNEHQDQSDSDERDSSSVAAPGDSSSTVEEHVEASLQDVANLRLSPGPASDVAERVSEVVVNDVLCSASREVRENVSSSDDYVQRKAINTAPTLTDRISTTCDNLAVSIDSDTVVGNRHEHQSTNSQDSEADSKLNSTLQTSHDITSLTSASVVADGVDSNELLDRQCRSFTADEHGECSQLTAAVEETNDASPVVNVEKNSASHG